MLQSQQHIEIGAGKGSKGKADVKLVGIGKKLGSSVLSKEGNVSVLARSGVSQGVSGVTGQALQMESAYRNECHPWVLQGHSDHFTSCSLCHTNL